MEIEELKLGNEVNEHFILGLMKGYNDYLKVRIDAANKLEISNGYVYTRGNHLEDQISKQEVSENVRFEHAIAGSWQYLKFEVLDDDKTYLVIVRRSKRIEDIQNELKKKSDDEKEKNWLYPLSRYNDKFNLDEMISGGKDKQLTLYGENFKDTEAIFKNEELDIDLEDNYDGFYILTYEIDPITYKIDDAKLLMMDPMSLDLLEIESLRSLVLEYESIVDLETLTEAKKVINEQELSGAEKEFIFHKTEDISAEDDDYPSEETSSTDEEIEES